MLCGWLRVEMGISGGGDERHSAPLCRGGAKGSFFYGGISSGESVKSILSRGVVPDTSKRGLVQALCDGDRRSISSAEPGLILIMYLPGGQEAICALSRCEDMARRFADGR